LVGKSVGKRLVGRPRPKWEDNIITDLREIDCEVVVWVRLAQDRDQWRALVYKIMSLRVPLKRWKFLD
jgi:hypothetical protein